MASQTTGQSADSRPGNAFDPGGATAKEREMVRSGHLTEAELRELIEYDSGPETGIKAHTIPEELDADPNIQNQSGDALAAAEQTDDRAGSDPQEDRASYIDTDGPRRPAPDSGLGAERTRRPELKPADCSHVGAKPQPFGEDDHNLSDQSLRQEWALGSERGQDITGSAVGQMTPGETPPGTDRQSEAHMKGAQGMEFSGMTEGPVPGSCVKTARFALQKPFRRGLRYASVLLLAAGFGAVGYFAGNPNGSPSDVRHSSGPADSAANRDMSAPTRKMTAHAQTAAAPSADAESAAFSSQEIWLPGHPAETPPTPIVVRLEQKSPRPVTQPLAEDGPVRWDDLFETLEDGRGPLSASNATLDSLPMPTSAPISESASGSLVSQESEAAYGHETGPDNRLTEDRTIPVGMAGQPPQTGEIGAGIHDSAADGFDDRGGADRIGLDPRHALVEILSSQLITLGERVKSAEDRLRVLEQALEPSMLQLAATGPASDFRGWPLRGGEAAAGQSAWDAETAENWPRPASERYSLVSVRGDNAPSALLTAEAGDVIEGYGTVTAVIRYDDGGIMLMMENGAVYVN